MRIAGQSSLHLTYCLNVHPGETWAENLRAIETQATRVRDRLNVDGPFGLGLRIGNDASLELRKPGRLAELQDVLQRERLYVFTINGFPYGAFHGRRVKENVYAPDWRTSDRRDYTIRLAEILARLLPEDTPGSISTVPGSYRPWIRSDSDEQQIAHRLAETTMALARIRSETGRDICLAIEPEPDCYLQTAQQVADFLTGRFRKTGTQFLKLNAGLDDNAGEQILRRHVGLCLDTAHAAVQMEDPAGILREMQARGVRVAKIQLSAAMACAPATEALTQLEAFCDPVYLHQVHARRCDGLDIRFPDLRPAIDQWRSTYADEDPERWQWRVHFHVPLYLPASGAIRPAGLEKGSDFAALLRNGACSQLEIETYTFGVLPEAIRPADVTEGIAREYRWVLDELLSRPS